MKTTLALLASFLASAVYAQSDYDGPPIKPQTSPPQFIQLDRGVEAGPLSTEGTPWSWLAALSPAEQGTYTIEVELGQQANPAAMTLARQIEASWNSGNFDLALAGFHELSLVAGSRNLVVGSRRRDARPASLQELTGVDVRVGDQDSVEIVGLQIDRANGHLFALLEYTTGSLWRWALYMSTDNGASWTLRYTLSSPFTMVDVALSIVREHVYVAYVYRPATAVHLRRFRTADGTNVLFADSSQFLSVLNADSSESIKDIVLTSDHAVPGGDARLYCLAIASTGKLKFYWNIADSVQWYPLPNTVTTASRGLSATFSGAGSRESSAAWLWVSYLDTMNILRIDSIGGPNHELRHAISSNTGSANSMVTSISAYRDTVLCAYEKVSSVFYAQYLVSYSHGRDAWRTATVGGDTSVASQAPAVALEGGGGMGIVYRYYTPRPRQGRFVWRTYAPGTWSNPLTFAENEPFVNQPSIIYLGGGRYGVLYLSWETPFQRAAYFDVVGNETSTGIAETGNGKPEAFSLEQNYPNPFNPKTGVRFQVPPARQRSGGGVSDVKLTVYDLLGREVAVLVNERKVPGSYEVTFDGSGLASGIYFYRLTAGSFIDTKKMVLVK